jgi:hypothetical protein
MDYPISGLTVSDIAGVNGALQPTVQKRVTFYVGTRGPFYLTYDQAAYNPEKVIADVQAEVSRLKQIDAGLGVQ